MKEKQIYGLQFETKSDLLKWIDENYDKIDWDLPVCLEWYWKDEKEEEE